MKKSRTTHFLTRLTILCTILGSFAILPLLSKAQPATSVTIVNNSNRSIRYVYLAHVGADDWSADQLGGASIGPGQSFSLSNVSCDQAQVKLIGEDQDGCFVSGVASCGSSSTWTITTSTPADCN